MTASVSGSFEVPGRPANSLTSTVTFLPLASIFLRSGALARFPGAKWFHDYRLMFEQMSDQIDAVVVTVPDHMHFAIAMTALRYGKHLYVEKPLCRCITEVRALHDYLRRGGRMFVNYSWAAQPDWNPTGGELGKLLGFELGPQPVFHLITDPRYGAEVRGLDGDAARFDTTHVCRTTPRPPELLAAYAPVTRAAIGAALM